MYEDNSLKGIITAYEALTDTPPSPSRDYPGLRNRVLLDELKAEITFLKSLFKKPERFELKFKERLRYRNKDTKDSLPVSRFPSSVTNRLYWDVAMEVFKPTTLGEMLRLFYPECRMLCVELSDVTAIPKEYITSTQRQKYMRSLLDTRPLEWNEAPFKSEHFSERPALKTIFRMPVFRQSSL